jgi:hypothetical protein
LSHGPSITSDLFVPPSIDPLSFHRRPSKAHEGDVRDGPGYDDEQRDACDDDCGFVRLVHVAPEFGALQKIE